MFDFKVYRSSICLAAIFLLFYIVGNFFLESWLPAHEKTIVWLIEQVQAIMLFAMVVYSVIYANKVKKHKNLYFFWLWTALWWLMLLGRSTSWGRVYFPEIPREYFRAISVVLILAPIVLMFTQTIRQEIKRRFFYEKIPVWDAVLPFVYLAIVDIVEHERIGYSLFVLTDYAQEILEELFEFPCIASLMLMVFYLQRNEQLRLSSIISSSPNIQTQNT